MITISDNTVPQINAALLRLDNNFDSAILELRQKESSDVGRLELKIDEIKRGTLVYTAGANINISNTGVISATVPTLISELYNDVGYITSASIPTNVSSFNNDAGYITKDVNDLTYYTPTSGLATVATSGDYDDLLNKPTIPAAQVNADWNSTSGVSEILNKPTIPAAQVQSDWTETDPTSMAYILNKPSSQVVNDGATNLYQGNSASRHLFGSWSANQSSSNNVYIDDGFTYIVDSDTALQNWQLGAIGYDYTSVLIKKGTWTLNPSNGSIPLDSRSTKRVYGEPGSKILVNYNIASTANFNVIQNSNYPSNLNVTGGASGIPAMRNKYDMWVENVSIEIHDQLTSNYSGRLVGFYNLANLHRCRVYFHRTATGSTGGKQNQYGFYYCYFLTQCQCNTENSRQYGRPFGYCYYLSNCDALSSGYASAQCYIYCYYLSTCTGCSVNLSTGTAAANDTAFNSCYYLTSCYGYGSYHSGASLHGCGAISCYNLVACYMYGYVVGFSGCVRMNSCFAESSGSSYPAIVGCYQVLGCASTTGYQDSYASRATNSSYACADTPNGGFNYIGY